LSLHPALEGKADTMAGTEVTFVGTYTIPEGKFEEWKAAIVDMIDFVKASAPRLLSFEAFLSDDSTEATSIYTHPDTQSLEQHLEAASSRIQAGSAMVQVKRIDLYGVPSEQVVTQLRRMAEQHGSFPVTVKAHFYGS
jgi:hypothetical protein